MKGWKQLGNGPTRLKLRAKNPEVLKRKDKKVGCGVRVKMNKRPLEGKGTKIRVGGGWGNV